MLNSGYEDSEEEMNIFSFFLFYNPPPVANCLLPLPTTMRTMMSMLQVFFPIVEQ